MTDPKTVRVRFAPSPTGTLHTGGVRTALFNYLFAKQNNGHFVLRIDDTDKARSTKEFEQDILNGLKWVGFDYDEICYQSERSELYKKYLNQLLTENKIYVSKEEIKKESDLPEVIRFRNPNKKVKFTDLIKGEIEFDTTELGDFIVAKDLETPLYHFASVVDDFDLGITHLIRGEDHLSNTPRQILMWEALGATMPQFAHLPLILAPDRSKLSKRKHASIASLNNFIAEGYLSEALINFVALLGWSPQGEKELTNPNEEILSLADLVKLFKLEKVQKSGAIFNVEKLNWINREYLLRLPIPEIVAQTEIFLPELKNLPESSKLNLIFKILLERIHTFGEIKKMAGAGELTYFFTTPEYPKELLKNQNYFTALIELIEKIPDNQFTSDKIKTAVWDYATQKGRGEVLWPMRIALTGQKQSPDPFTVAEVLGKPETLKRLTHARDL
jgi:glutamyl-tRNA synthetase